MLSWLVSKISWFIAPNLRIQCEMCEMCEIPILEFMHTVLTVAGSENNTNSSKYFLQAIFASEALSPLNLRTAETESLFKKKGQIKFMN